MLNFSIPYFDATSGNSNWGITLCINDNGAYTTIKTFTNLNGNGIASFSWITKPGIYDGFKAIFTNEYGSTTSIYNEQFDVYSGLVSVNQPSSNNPCISDSTATSYYNSNGNVIGYLILTGTIGGNQVYNSGNQIQMGLQMEFVSTADNVTANKFTYGIFNYGQSLNYSGSQNGETPSTAIIPYNSAAQASSTNQNTSTNCCLAEHALYDVIKSGQMFSEYGIGLALDAVGTFQFQSEKGGSDSSYWNQNVICGNRYSFYNWDDSAGNNCPPQIYGYGIGTLGNGFSAPVYTVVNNGNGDPSYIQNLNIGLTIGNTGLSSSQQGSVQISQQALFWYNYSARATIVPISHIYINNAGSSVAETFNFNQNDYVNATWHSTQNNWELWTYGSGYFVYNGPSYSGASPSLKIYFAMEG